jgi:peptide/nickel transport system substrate-binding protein
MVQFPQDLHPYSPNSVAKLVVLRAGLRTVTVNDGLKTSCQLCTTLPTFENGGVKIVTRSDGVDTMEVTYTLRPDLFWADGEPVTATDVAFGFQIGQWLQPQRLISAVAAIDPHVFQVKIAAVRADYADLIPAPVSEHVEGPIARASHDPQTYLRRSAFARAPETPGLWMGPYRVGERRPDTITLLPNPYWKGEPLAFKSIALKLIESTAVLQSKLNSGEIDMPMPEAGLSAPQVFALAARPGPRFDVSFIATTNIEHIVVNLDNKLLADRRAARRQPVAAAHHRADPGGRQQPHRHQLRRLQQCGARCRRHRRDQRARSGQARRLDRAHPADRGGGTAQPAAVLRHAQFRRAEMAGRRAAGAGVPGRDQPHRGLAREVMIR